MEKRTEFIFKELAPWRDLIEDITPFGEDPEQAYEDKTTVFANAPRALMAQAFQAKIDLLYDLMQKGLLKKHPMDGRNYG